MNMQVRTTIESESKYKTNTGWLCLDFANTVDWHASSNPEETINNYADLLNWAKKVEIVSPNEAKLLQNASEKAPAKAQAILNRAKEIREAIYETLASISHRRPARKTDLAIINKAIADMLSHSKLILKDNGFAWDWDSKRNDLDFILWPVARSTAELMTSEALHRVGQCADEHGCGWLFWDSSRNKNRRWCDMRDCGNRAKARRFYKKIKSNTN
jgi:predicted RNA-binding Zn ribbon-like protein